MLGKNREKKKTFCPKSSILTHFWPFFAQKRPFLTILPPTPPTPLFSSFRTRRFSTRARARVTGCSGPLCRFSTQRYCREETGKFIFPKTKSLTRFEMKIFLIMLKKNLQVHYVLHQICSLWCISRKDSLGLQTGRILVLIFISTLLSQIFMVDRVPRSVDEDQYSPRCSQQHIVVWVSPERTEIASQSHKFTETQSGGLSVTSEDEQRG